MPKTTERKDILLEPMEKKEEIYRLIDDLIKLLGFGVNVKEDKSGFPAVTMDCGGVHILTDILTLEQWAAKQKKQKGGADEPEPKVQAEKV